MQRKNILIISTILLSLAACGSNKLKIKFVDKTEYKYGEQVNSCSLITSVNNKKVEPDNIKDDKIVIGNLEVKCGAMDTHTVGQNKVTYEYNGTTYEFTYTVKDGERPVIVVDDEIFIEKDKEFNIADYAMYIDNSNQASFTIRGNVDTTTDGRYEIRVECKDEAGNYNEKDIWVTVGQGGKDHPLPQEVINSMNNTRDPNADKLIEQMGKLPVEEKIEQSINSEIKTEELKDHIKVNNESCKFGEYEIEANNSMEAAMKAMNKYGCLQVEAKPIYEEVPVPTPETSDESESAPTPEPEKVVKKYKVTCICSRNESIKNGDEEYKPEIVEDVEPNPSPEAENIN